MAASFRVHTSTLFDPKKKELFSNISNTINPISGTITGVYERKEELGETVPEFEVDLRGKTTVPGFVDAHTRIFLHSYE